MCHQGLFLSQSLVVFKEFINVRQVEFEPSQQNQKPTCKQEYPTKKQNTNTQTRTHARARARAHTHTQAQATLSQSLPPGRCMTRPKVQFLTGTPFVRGRGGERSPLTSWAFFRWSLSSQNLVRKAILGSHTLFCRGTETEGERAATTDGGWNRRSPVELKASDL